MYFVGGYCSPPDSAGSSGTQHFDHQLPAKPALNFLFAFYYKIYFHRQVNLTY